MPDYPEQSHVAEWSLVEDGDKLRMKVVHKDKQPESLWSSPMISTVVSLTPDGFIADVHSAHRLVVALH